jgi:hypothetical protein
VLEGLPLLIAGESKKNKTRVRTLAKDRADEEQQIVSLFDNYDGDGGDG